MARSIPTIYQQLLAQKNAQSGLSSLTSTSQVAIWNLWLWITAAGQALFEQLCDLFQSNIETTIAVAPVFSIPWMQNMLLLFQYSSSSPQAVVVSTSPPFTIGYNPVNPALQIIEQNAVVVQGNRSILLKVANVSNGAGGPVYSGPTDPIYLALVSYINAWMIPGTQYLLRSVLPDLIYCEAIFYVDGAYMGTAPAGVAAAFAAFLSDLPFNDTFTVSSLVDAFKAVSGVEDVVIVNLQGRQYNVSFGDGYNLVVDQDLIEREYSTYAGYSIPENTSGEDILSVSTFVPQ